VYEVAKEYVNQLKSRFPQTCINGNLNLWIVKPGGLSRGRNIQIFDNFIDILKYSEVTISSDKYINNDNITEQKAKTTTGKSWIVQKYIESPLLISNRKFDIRVWVLVSSWNPLCIFLYQECYIRFSATDYEPKNIKNLFSHLTNNSITKNCN
jgi:tubulin monoglycylase TTLL3/8